MTFLKSIVAVVVVRVQSSDAQHSVISRCRLGQIEREQRDLVLVAEHEATGQGILIVVNHPLAIEWTNKPFGAFVMDISKPQRCWVHVEQVGDELVLRWRAKWYTAAGWFAFFLFFLLLTAFWVFVIAHRHPSR